MFEPRLCNRSNSQSEGQISIMGHPSDICHAPIHGHFSLTLRRDQRQFDGGRVITHAQNIDGPSLHALPVLRKLLRASSCPEEDGKLRDRTYFSQQTAVMDEYKKDSVL